MHSEYYGTEEESTETRNAANIVAMGENRKHQYIEKSIVVTTTMSQETGYDRIHIILVG